MDKYKINQLGKRRKPMRIKRILLSTVLTIAMMVPFAIPAIAADEPTLTVGSAEAQAGDRVIIPVTVANNPGIAAANIQLSVPAGITLVDAVADWEEYNEDNGTTYGYANGVFRTGNLVVGVAEKRVVWANTSNRTTNGHLFYLILDVSPGAMTGNYTISTSKISTAGTMFNNVEQTGVVMDLVSGTITVTSGPSLPDTGYAVSISPDQQNTFVGTTAEVTIAVLSAAEAPFNAFDITLSFDQNKLTYSSVSPSSGVTVFPGVAGEVRFTGYGANKSIGPFLDVTFNAIDTTTSTGTTVAIESAKIDEQANAYIQDAPDAVLIVSSVTVVIDETYYNVSLGSFLTGPSKAFPGQPYTFSVDNYTNYDYTLTVLVGGSSVLANVINNGDGTYTIPATYVTGDIDITATRTGKSRTVTFAGTGAGDATGAATATYGTDYSFTLTKASGYSYVVTMTIGGEAYTGYSVDANTYTIPGADVLDDIVITVNKTLDLSVSVDPYINLDGKTIFLVTAYVELGSGSVLQYAGAKMYWSEGYDAFAYLVISTDSAENVKTEAEGNITATTGTTITVDYSGDVNGTGLVDINDTQLVYNMYNAMYDDFNSVTILMFLCADMNTDKTVNVQDAQAVVAKLF